MKAHKKVIQGLLFSILLIIAGATLVDSAEVTITTYYPAPYGEYQELYVSGNVGIGTTSPAAKLDVNGAIYLSDGSAGAPALAFRADTNTGFFRQGPDKIIFVANGQHALFIDGTSGHGELGIMADPAIHLAIGDSDTGFQQQGENELAIYTANSERVRINSSGNVGIGDSTPTEAKLVVNGTAANSTGVWSNLSDRRLKKDIQPLEGSLSKVLKLQGVSFYWKDSERGEGLQRGFIGQDVEDVIPEWVKTDDDGYKRLEKVGVEALLVEAIKELKVENKALKAKLDEFEIRMSNLEVKVKKL